MISGAGGLVRLFSVLALDNIWLVAVAGVLALVSGVCTLRINERLRKTSDKVEEGEAEATRLALESQVMAARAARFEAEAINARLTAARNERTAATAEFSIDDLAGMIDEDTGLFNERFFLVTTEKRLSAARAALRPLTIVLLEVAERVCRRCRSPADPRIIAGCLMETLREADTACRLDDGRFALVLEDTPENGAVWTVERVRRRMADRAPRPHDVGRRRLLPRSRLRRGRDHRACRPRARRRPRLAAGPHRGRHRPGLSARGRRSCRSRSSGRRGAPNA